MFSAELKFVSGCIKKWFYKKYKSKFLELDTVAKQKYDKKLRLIGLIQNALFVDFYLLLQLILNHILM